MLIYALQFLSEVIPMEYLDVHETAKKWGVTERRVTLLCRNSRIPMAKKFGRAHV